jgi:glycosyltransferase involved in cell wall biosynthesis
LLFSEVDLQLQHIESQWYWLLWSYEVYCLQMHLIVTIPAYNEEETIADVVRSIPKKINGISKIDVLVWSDGSTDDTAAIAKKSGASFVFSSKKNLGLARTFDLATTKAVELGADIIVNTDADNQYDQKEISLLIQPILSKQADVVNGDRQVEKLDHMPLSKKLGNLLGSQVIRILTGLAINDASSGFRAYTAQAITALNIFSRHTYTHETLVQIAFSDFAITEVPVTFRARKGGSNNSRLIKGVLSHIVKSGSTIIRTLLMFKALRVFVTLGMVSLSLSALLGLRYLWYFFLGASAGHIQSLILASMLFNLGLLLALVGVIADLIAINRKIMNKSQL